MAEAIILREHGGPERLRLESVEVARPGPGEVRLRQTAVGVNFHDVYVRGGLYRTLALPGIPGIEAVGVVEEVGPGVGGFAPGDRVGYIAPAYGAYASERVLPADLALRLPEGLDDRLAATVLLKGLTAEMLVHRVRRVRPGEWLLVHAAAGGVGQLLCRWASHLGARVIGTAGGPEKAELARQAGCEDVVLYREQDFVERVREITGGRGVNAAYDSVGRDTFEGSLACLAPLGHLVNFGQSSGPVPPFEVSRLAARSTTLSRPILFHYTAGREALDDMAASLFEALADGVLRPEPGHAFALADAAAAHAELESRRATGPLVLLP